MTDDQLENIDRVADRLAAKGLKVERVLPMTGVIVGTSTPKQISALEQIDGVMSVEEEGVAYLPHPTAPVQ
ncbi:MAG: hypothetical protein KME17_07560 [Cyanosarcina radialis HA8281-LM2]|nr:hypothetical protein [Cyanosarcina radialis HA8281-LM2]